MKSVRFYLGRHWPALMGLLLLVLFLRLPMVWQPFENDSGAIAYHARLITRGEPLYGSHHPSHHMPGAYYLYALAFSLFGDAVSSVKGLLLIWVVLTVFLVYHLGGMSGNRMVGVLGGIFSALLLSHTLLAGTTSKIELFVGLPQLIALLTLFILIRRRSPPWMFFLVGASVAMVFLFKVNYVLSPLVISVVAITVDGWAQGRRWQTVLWRFIWIGIGITIGLLPLLLYLATQDLFQGFVTLFTLGLGYTGVPHPELTSPVWMILYPLLILARSNPIILIGSVTGFVIIGLKALMRLRRRPHELVRAGGQPIMLYVALWFGVCFVETGVSRVYLHNYYLVFVPPASLLAGWLFKELFEKARAAGGMAIANAVLATLMVAALSFQFADHLSYYANFYGRYLVGRASYTEVLLAGMPERAGETAVSVDNLAEYLQARTNPSDTIYYWSSLMQLYYAVDRRSSYEVIWPIYAGALGDREDIFDAKYFLVGNDPLGYEEKPEWLLEGLATHYELETVLHGQAIFRRKGE